MHTQTKVLIAGAGPTGLTLAIELARRGIPHRLIDAASGLLGGSRGKGLQPRTLEVFEDLGVLEAVQQSGGPYPPFRVHVGPISFPAGSMHKNTAPSLSIPYPNLWMLPQWRTAEILYARLGQLGGVVEFGSQLVGFEQDADGVTATLSTGEEVERVQAEYLVGCDGAHSFVRKGLPVRFRGEALESRTIVLADVEIDGLDRAHWHAWPLVKGCMLALCPLPGTARFQLMATLSRGAAPPEMSEECIRDFIRNRIGKYVGQIGRVSWMSLYRPKVFMVDSYRVGRVLLAGDAAHVHPPAGGQGLNTGIQDAYNLGWKLASTLRGAPATLLDTYEAERLPVAAGVLGLSKELWNKGSFKRGPETQQLGLHYRTSVISVGEVERTRRIRAGDRAPDARCLDKNGAPCRLFEIFRGPHLTVLLFGVGENGMTARVQEKYKGYVKTFHVLRSDERAGADVLLDVEENARKAYDLGSDAAVIGVRPDGYIGYFGSPGSWAGLERFLSAVLQPFQDSFGQNQG